jgi:hypothetical protein
MTRETDNNEEKRQEARVQLDRLMARAQKEQWYGKFGISITTQNGRFDSITQQMDIKTR